ncbi:UxaA family hydrolase [Uliginosibacterium sp. sgz301328]|uniref:UxaA family hydrolase n=1 Tax=Uliginosibacterium sp. sgz301328 TaxID=3243764 RepID=UPI00359E260C
MVHFVVHDRRDTTGVVVVEGVEAGQTLTGWLMDGDDTLTITVRDAIPIGHKLALKNIATSDDVIKYGEIIGVAVAPISRGEHLHVHNVKTKRW